MPAQHQLVGRIAGGLLVVVIAAGCKLLGPDLNISVDNTGPREVTVTVDSSGGSMTTAEDTTVSHGESSAWSVPLGSTWEIKIDGKHVIGSGDGTDLAQPSPGHGQDVNICIQVAPDGALKLDDGCWVGATEQSALSG
jgi:hypothetical protein